MNKKTSRKEKKENRKQREYRKKCEDCGTMSKAHRMFDVDGKNLVEYLVCLECGLGTSVLF